VGPNTDGPPPLRKMILPALFVGGLFYVSFTRTPEIPQQIVIQGEALGTTWTVKSSEPASVESEQAIRVVVEDALELVDGQMSTYREDSDLMKLNAASASDGFEVPEQLGEVLTEALLVSSASTGAFDVTIGPAVRAWGFGPDKTRTPPSSEVLQALTPYVGSDKLRLDGDKVYKAHPALELDLSAIAKGYAVDLIAERLAGEGRANLMVEVGGEIVARGHNPTGNPWRLGIETPTSEGREVLKVVSLNNAAMATSGDYRNHYEVDGKRVSHLIDPRTMRPIEHRLASVTVVHQRCATADAWATALSVLGDDAGFLLAEAQGLQAFFIVREADGSFTNKSTTSFKALEQ
jgi:thiamine biosynthesis lipoprotein